VQKKKKGSLVLKLFLALILLGTGFGAVVLIFREQGSSGGTAPSDASGSGSDAIAAVVPDAAIAEPPPPPPEPDAAEPDIEMDPTPAKPTAGSAAKPTTRPTKPTTTTTKPTTTKPGAGSGGGSAEKPAGDGSAAPSVTDAPLGATDDDCDETSCILSKYDRACCAKYKPKDTGADFKPRVGDVPEALDKSMVRAGIDRVKPRVVACGEKSGGAKGTVKISMQVSPDGAVTSASVAAAPDPALGECVLAAMRSAKFGKTVNGASFTYPFAF
jgi:TonB family protein